MSLTTEYYVTVKRTVRLHRRCSHCGNTWSRNKEIEIRERVTGPGPLSKKYSEELTTRLHRSEKNIKQSHRYYIVCPKCSHLDETAKNFLFARGYQEGLKGSFYSKMSGFDYLMVLVSLGLGLGLTIGHKEIDGQIGALIVGIFMLIGAIGIMTYHILKRINKQRVHEWIEGLSNDEALELIVGLHSSGKAFPEEPDGGILWWYLTRRWRFTNTGRETLQKSGFYATIAIVSLVGAILLDGIIYFAFASDIYHMRHAVHTFENAGHTPGSSVQLYLDLSAPSRNRYFTNPILMVDGKSWELTELSAEIKHHDEASSNLPIPENVSLKPSSSEYFKFELPYNYSLYGDSLNVHFEADYHYVETGLNPGTFNWNRRHITHKVTTKVDKSRHISRADFHTVFLKPFWFTLPFLWLVLVVIFAKSFSEFKEVESKS